MTEYITKTQEVLGPLITAPKLTEKLLSKPPFRFLHDIITGFIKAHKFPENLFSDDQLDSAKVTDKEAKIEFLQLLISVIEAATHKTCAAKPQKIVAGQEPESTNQLLQLLAECAALTDEQKAAVVQSAKSSGKPTATPAASKPEAKPEAKKEERKKSSGEQQEEKVKAEDEKKKKEKEQKDAEAEEEAKKKKKNKEEEEQQREQLEREKNEAAAKAKAKAEAEEKEKERKAREQRREKEKREKAEKEKAEKEKLKQQQEEEAAKENVAKQQKQKEQQEEEEEKAKANEKKERSSDEERHRHRHHHHREHQDGEEKSERDDKEKKSRHHRSSESERSSKERKSIKAKPEEKDEEEVFKRQLAPSPSANSSSVNETQSAGKAPPKTRRTHEVISSNEERNKSINAENNNNKDNSKDNNQVERDEKIDAAASRHKRGKQDSENSEGAAKDSSRKDKQSSEALASDKHKTNKVNAKYGSKDHDNKDDDKDDDEDDDAHNWEKIAEQFEKRSAMQRAGGPRNNLNSHNEEEEDEIKGVLGQQALRAKKDQESMEAAERFGEQDEVDHFLSKNAASHDESGIVIRNKRTTHGRDATGLVLSDHELQRLREQIQQLTKASNPLGKFLEVIHNDIDSMTRELEMWRAEARNQVMAAAEARRQTQEGLQEVQAQIQNVNEAIADQLIKINNMRRTIINNDRAVDGMVRMIVTPDANK